MMKLFQKKDGAVSVFLALILIPMMIVASIMIDYGRVQLGSAMASSAGDLTLNTALSEYDNVLKDLYGLFATSQSNEELLDSLEEYYTSSILAQGIPKADADDYVGQIMDMIKGVADGSSSDFMNMSVTDFNVNEPSEGSLVNPTLLRGQIVNFMKFRAPINGGMALLESLKSFSNLDKQMKLVEDKQKYYDEHASVLEHCEKAWGYMEVYLSHCKGASYFNNTKAVLDGYNEKYKNINNNMIKKYYNGENSFYVTNSCTFKEENNEKIWSLIFNGSEVQKSTSYNNQAVENADIQELFQIFATTSNVDFLNKYNVSGIYSIQVVVQFNIDCENQSLSGYGKNIKNLFVAYYNLKNMYDRLSDEQKDLRIDKTGLNITDDESISVSVKEKFKEFTDFFNIKMSEYKTFTDNVAIYYNNKCEDFNKTKEEIKNNISNISSEIQGIKSNLENAKEALDKCSEELEKVMNEVNPGNPNSNLQKALKSWSSSANNSAIANESLAQQDQAEISHIKEFIKYEDVKTLYNRVVSASKEIGKEISEIDKYTYCGQSIGNVSSIIEIRNLISSAVNPTIPFMEGELNNLAVQTFNTQYKSGDFMCIWSDQSVSPIFSDNQCRFYTYLYKNYHRGNYNSDINNVNSDKTSDAKKKSDSQKEKIKNTGEKSKEEAKKGNITESKDVLKFFSDKDNNNLKIPSESDLIKNNKSNVPSISTEDVDSKKSSGGIASLFAGISEKLKSAAVDIRDYIYIEQYVMGMFSYNTYDKEIKDKLKSGEKYEDKALSLTKIPVNSINNYSYLKEVEYIVYGGNNCTTKTYSTIYAIRVAMNSIYAFTNSEIRNGAYSIAMSIFGVPPLTPLVPVAQVAIIVAVALAESGIDLMYLKEGKAVPLFKDSKTWCLSFSKLLQVLKEEVTTLAKEVTDNAVNKAKDKLNDWLDLTEEEIKNKVNQGGEELTALTDQIKDNINSEVDRYVGVITNELTALCTKANDMVTYGKDDSGNIINDDNKTEIRVKYIKENLKSWWDIQKNNLDTSSLAYKIQETAMTYLLNDMGNEISDLINTIDTYGGKGIENAENVITKKINSINDKINKSVKTKCTEINEYISGLKENLKKSANEGIDKFNDELNNGIDRLFGVESTGKSLDIDKSQTSGIASKFKFRYSDYLGVFLIVSLLGNEEGVMGRIADVIEVNMSTVTNSKFDMYNSYVYVKLNASLEVKPLLMTLPFMDDITQAKTKGKNFYTITYDAVGGY